MAKRPLTLKTVTSGEFLPSPGQKRATIGFQPNHMRSADTTIVSSRQHEPQIDFAGLLNEADATMLKAMRFYMEERARRCYREGVDRDFMAKVDKIYTKYFEEID